jgi:dTDP-4-dehydrorhamnose 3,5-epimerase
MSRLELISTPFSQLVLVKRKPLSDSRGYFVRLFCRDELAQLGWNTSAAQINLSSTDRKGTIRGMHFQYPPFSEKKLLLCLKGSIQDFVVDLRADSPTFLQYYSVILSAENCLGLHIPEGFAHGFQTITDKVKLLYLHSVPYTADAEAGLNPFDPSLALPWPLPVSEISDRDRQHPDINNSFKGMQL